MFNRISTPFEDFSIIPSTPGIYRFIDEYQDILYIGASKNLQKRVLQYFRSSKVKERKYSKIQLLTRYIEFQAYLSEEAAFEAERVQIWANQPKLNIRNNGIHSYSYLILRNEPHPHLVCNSNEIENRIRENDKIFRINIHSIKLRELIDQIRRRNRFCTSTKRENCWEHQLNLCSRTCVQKDDENTNLIRFVNCLTSSDSTLINDWSNELTSYVERMQYEKAQKLYLSLSALKTLRQRFAGIGQPFEKSHFEFSKSGSQRHQIQVDVYSYQKGKLFTEKSQILNRTENFSLEVLILYFLQDYFQKNTIIPKKVSLNIQLSSKTQLRFKNWMRRYFHQPILLESNPK